MTLVTASLLPVLGLAGRAFGVLLMLATAPGLAQADGGTRFDAASGSPSDGGAFSASDGSAGVPAGAATDGGNTDGGSTNGEGDTSTRPNAACSCETKEGEGARVIHLCTGSYDAKVCDGLRCDAEANKASCDDDSPVQLCCEMKERSLYTYLYSDCTHPNCEGGFRAQCRDFGGQVLDGMCSGAPPKTTQKATRASSGSCRNAVTQTNASSAQSVFWLLALSLMTRRVQRRA